MKFLSKLNWWGRKPSSFYGGRAVKYTVKVYPNDNQHWYLNGKRHREDGPAVVWPDGGQEWWLNGNLHREDGPALVWPNGYQGWYLNGKRVTQAKVEALNKPDGIVYTLERKD